MDEINAHDVKSLMEMKLGTKDEVERALIYSKGDVKKAASILTDNSTPVYQDMHQHQLHTNMIQGHSDNDNCQCVDCFVPPPYEDIVAAPLAKQDVDTDIIQSPASCYNSTVPVIFPTECLYELERRVYVDSWSIPYKPDEALGRCLVATTDLALEDLAEANEECVRFMTLMVPDCVSKLMTSNAVQRWSEDVYRGIFHMLEMIVELVVARLKNGSLPVKLLTTLTQVFDCSTEYHRLNASKSWDRTHYEGVFGFDEPYAVPSELHKNSYGWVINLINKFAETGGFDYLTYRFQTTENLDVEMMISLLQPIAICAEFCNRKRVQPLLQDLTKTCTDYIKNIKEENIKKTKASIISDLLVIIKRLCIYLICDEPEVIDDLRLETTLRMLKMSHFNTKMSGLKEIIRIMEESESIHPDMLNKHPISKEKVLTWLQEKDVLGVTLGGYLHQHQYCDKLARIIEFYGAKLPLDALSLIWKAQISKGSPTVENIHNCLAAASVRFSSDQLDHLFTLIHQSWRNETSQIQNREKLLVLIGKIGQEARVPRIATKVLDLLWSLAHLPTITTDMVTQALKSHSAILSYSYLVKENVKQSYALKCIEDIKKGSWIVPALKQLLKILKAMTRQIGSQRQDRGIVHDIEKSHDMIKLTTVSLVKCHRTAVSVAGDNGLSGAVQIDGRYAYSECLNAHLDLLSFVLNGTNLYLHWHRARDIWNCLVSDPDACCLDMETCYDWFIGHISYLEEDAKAMIFNQLIQKLSPSKLSVKGFECFRTFFESINHGEHKLKGSIPLVVEKVDLIGLSYLWQIVLEATNENVADEAINYLIQICFTNVSLKLKKDSAALHKRFISEFQKRLEDGISVLRQSKIAQAVSLTAAMATAPASPESAIAKAGKRLAKILSVERILLLAEKYITAVEESFPIHKRKSIPHGVSFHDYPLQLHVTCDGHKDSFAVQIFANETLYSLRHKLALKLDCSMDHIQILYKERLLNSTRDHKLLHQLGLMNEQHLKVRMYTTSVAPPPYSGDEENSLPSVIISANQDLFQKLYQLTELDEYNITDRVVSLIMLIPTDMSVLKVLDAFSRGSNVVGKNTNSNSSDKVESVPPSMSQLANLFKCNAPNMSAFRVRYNLEALSGKLLPVKSEDYDSKLEIFRENFCNGGGLELVFDILQDNLTKDIEHSIRQGCFMLAVRIIHFLVIGRIPPAVCTAIDGNQSLVMQPEEGVRTADVNPNSTETVDGGCINAAVAENDVALSHKIPTGQARMESIQLDKFQKMFSGIMHIIKVLAMNSRGSTDRSRVEAATGDLQNLSITDQLQKSILRNYKDAVVIHESLAFLVTCLTQRFELIETLYGFTEFNNLVSVALYESSNSEIRSVTAQHLYSLSKITPGEIYDKIDPPYDLILKTIINVHVPFWSTSVSLRGYSAKLTEQCTQFFVLRCKLLFGLSLKDQQRLGVDPKDMLSQEINWLNNISFSDSAGEGPKCVLAGHLELTKTLLTCEGIEKHSYGKKLIPKLIDAFLFPASKTMLLYKKSNNATLMDVNPICGTPWTQLPTYDVLSVLATGSVENLKEIVTRLIDMHHLPDPELSRMWNYQPPIAPKADCGLVGLKNAGATCYMNSIIQQLYFQPGIPEIVLSVDEDAFKNDSDGNLLYALQLLFGHLKESKLQYYVPEPIWKNFRMWGRSVNLHEQQDAFEFFINLVDQIDEQLKQASCNQIFKDTFCGTLINQVVCKDCPHRYEREEQCWTLSLGVKCRTLQESLEQYVKGELLEGDNAYMCEKCQKKRNAIKRLCIKTLPSALVVQLKRFDYDWEIAKPLKFDDYFEFPWILNMEPYTLEGITAREKASHVQEDDSSETGSIDSASTYSLRPTNYELAGVVVHSGQANAGHYYSFIKDRRTQTWYKINDINVEEFTMSPETLESECFGGTYQPRSYDPYPTYHDARYTNKYWSGYMLFYDAITDDKLPPQPRLGSLDSHPESARSDSSVPDSPSSLTAGSDGLSQLAALVQKGEKRGLFSDSMPASIQGIVHEENLRFIRNQSIYNHNYFQFILRLACSNLEAKQESPELSILSLKLAIYFLVNTYFKVRDDQRCNLSEWCNCVERLINAHDGCCLWFITYLSEGVGMECLKPLLLECPTDSIREAFSTMVQQAIRRYYCCKRLEQKDTIAYGRLMERILQMLEREVPDYYRNCAQYFRLLCAMTNMGSDAVFHLLQSGALQKLLTFLIGSPYSETCRLDMLPIHDILRMSSGRKWSALQAREFSSIHIAICNLIVNCDVSVQQTTTYSSEMPRIDESSRKLLSMPTSVEKTVFGIEGVRYVHEALLASCEVAGITKSVANMLVHCCWCNELFSAVVLAKLLVHLSNVPSNELKNLFLLLTELITIDDPVKSRRFKIIIDGPENNGLLAIIKSSNIVDSRRAYQCIKFLVNLANKDELVRSYLIENTSRWHWAVQWLRKKMSESWAAQPTVSNESSTTKVFQRTMSAQDTLAEATALLSQIEAGGVARGTIAELDSQDSLQEDSEVDESHIENGEEEENTEDTEKSRTNRF